jgi:hypothetical protein
MKNLLLLVSLATFLVACPDDKPVPVDTSMDIETDAYEADTTDVVEADADAGTDADAEEPTLAFNIDGAQGAVGIGEDSVSLTAADDLDAAELGVQVAIAVQTTFVETGRIVSVFIDGAAVAAGPVVANGDSGVSNISVTFNASAGALVRLEVTNQAGDLASAEKTVVVVTESCTALVLPAAQDTCFSADSDPDTDGVQAEVTVETSDTVACPTAILEVTIGADTVSYGPADMDDDGKVVFSITVADSGEEVEGQVVVKATVQHGSDSGKNAEVETTYALDNVVPTVSITSPDPALTPTLNAGDDEDPIAAGIQTTASGTVEGFSEAGQWVSVTVNEEEAGTTPVEDGLWTYQVTLLEVGSATIGASATDGCGNTGTAEIQVEAFPVEPSLTIEGPTDGTVLLAKGDGDVATPTYEVDFNVQVEAPNAGDSLEIQCRSKAGNEQVFFTISASVVTEPFPDANTWIIPISLDPASLSNEAVCRAMIDGPNPAASPNINLVIGLPGPSITLETPINGALLSSKSSVAVSGTATGMEGQSLTLQLVGNGGVIVAELASEPVSGGLFAQDIDFESVAAFTDGKYTIQVDGTDTYGNVASDLNASGKAVVNFDTVAPLLVAVQPSGVFISGAEDQDPALPGFQTTVVMQMNNELVSDGAEICLEVAGEQLGCQGVTEGTFQATWEGVTLQPGPNNPLKATGNDAAGNVATPYNVTLNLDVDAPVVTITDPAETTVTVSDSINVTASVADSQTGQPVVAAAPTISVNGDASAVEAANNGDGTYTFEGVALVSGENQLQVLVDIGAQGASPIRFVTYKTGQPSIAITWPTEGQVLNLASAECAGFAADCTASVTASVTDAEDGSTASLSIGCGGDLTQVSGTVSGGAVTFTGAVLAHGGTCVLTPNVTDLAKQTVEGSVVNVTIDRVAPIISRFDEPFQEYLEPNYDLDPGTEGIQYKLEVVVQGVEEGQKVTVDLHLQGQAPGTIYEKVLDADAPDAVDTEVPFPVISYPDGAVELSATVTDNAGNSASLDKLVFVQSVKAAVQIKSPSSPSNDCGACGNDGLCNADTCWFKWNGAYSAKLFVTLGGFLDGTDNFRVCSDAASLAGGTACATNGYTQVYLGDAQDGLQSVDLSGFLPVGFQTLIAELKPSANGDWIASLDELSQADQSRRVNVDTASPAVTGLGSSSDTVEPNLVLNAAEQLDGQPAGTYNLEFTSDEAGDADVFVNGQLQSEIQAASGENATTVQLSAGGNEVYVRVTDANGNQSTGLPAAESYTPTVDLVAPTIEFSSPKNESWVGGDGTGSVILSVGLEPLEDEAAATVTLFDDGVEVGTAGVSGGNAVFVAALTEGAHTFTATVSDPSGNSATAATTPETVNVDLTAPVASITSPVDGGTVSEDADAQGGFQVQVDFDAGDAASDADWTLTVSTCVDVGFENCGAPSVVDSGTQAGVVSTSALATVTIGAAKSYFTFALTVTDQAGNESTSTVNATVEVVDCVVSFVDIPGTWINRSHCAPATDCDVTVNVLPSGSCGDVAVTLMDGASEAGTIDVTAGQQATFTLTVADGQALSLQGLAFVGASELGATNIVNLTTDTVLPTVTLLSQIVDSFNTTDGSGTEKYGTADDQNIGNGGTLEVHAFVRVTDTNAVNGGLVSVVRTEVDNAANTANLSPNVTTGANGADLDMTLKDIALPNQQSTSVAITVQDEAGNVSVATFTADADLDKPSSPFLSVGALNNRLPSVTLSWSATGDNGGSGGPAATYDIRYSRSAINSANFDSACNVADLPNAASVPSPSEPGTPETYVVSGPDPRSAGDPCKFVTDEANGTWYFGVRIADDVGNQSLLVAISIKSTDAVTLTSTQVEFSDAFATDVLAGDQAARDSLTLVGTSIGDVDGDGRADMAVGSAASNAACVIYGTDSASDTWTIDTKSSAVGLRHNCLLPGDLAQPQLSGASGLGGSVQALGDVNSDGRDDFAISTKVGGKGVLLVYMGRDDAQLIDLVNPDVILLTQKTSFPPAYPSFCGVGDFLGSAADDIGLGAIGFGTAFTVVSGDNSWTVGGNAVVDLGSPGGIDHLNIAVDSPVLGWGSLCSGAGDVLDTPDGGGARADLLMLPVGSNADDPLYVIPGRDVSGGESVTISLTAPAVPAGEDKNILRLRQEAGNLKTGFGTGGFFAADVTGDGTKDVIVTHPNRSMNSGGDGKSLMVFDGAVINQTGGGTYLRVQASAQVGDSWSGTNGYILNADISSSIPTAAAVGNWDGWLYSDVATIDLAIAGASGAGMLRLNHASDDGNYELGLFHASDVALSSDGVGALGGWVAAGDVDGDGRSDIISGTTNGKIVIIW